MGQYALGVIGLGVMGANLARNAASHGVAAIGYDRDARKVAALGASAALTGVERVDDLLAGLRRPRVVLLMVPAGAPVDSVIAELRSRLAPADIVIDGGNSFFRDTDRRCDDLAASGLHFLGAGVSGGEEGALHGPSIMPGGPPEAWDAVAPALRAMAARADDGEPCVAYMGPRGAGHYVKMVHNGIEYGDMQLIAETYDLLHRGAGIPASELAQVFAEWNRGAALLPDRDHGDDPGSDRRLHGTAARGRHPR
jgi:6-phosphogluconate dehydrogenase